MLCAYEPLTRYVLIELDVSLGHAEAVFVGHLGYLLSLFAHKALLGEPFAYKLFGELALGFSLGEAFFEAFGIEVARAIGCMDLVYEVDLTILFPELVLGVYEDESHLFCNLATTSKEILCVLLEKGVVLFAYKSGAYYLLTRYVFIVPLIRLGGGGDNGMLEALILAKPFSKGDAADRARPFLISAPCTTCNVAADYHFYFERLALMPDGNHGVGGGYLPVGHDVGRGI